MVVALATDEGVWRAVLANTKIQEYRVRNAEGISSQNSRQNSTKSFVDIAEDLSRRLLPSINLGTSGARSHN